MSLNFLHSNGRLKLEALSQMWTAIASLGIGTKLFVYCQPFAAARLISAGLVASTKFCKP